MKNLARLSLLFCCLATAGIGWSHIDWTRVNAIDPDCLALYHMNATSANAGDVIPVEPGLPDDLALTLQAPAGAAAIVSSNIAKSIFGPSALRFNSAQAALSTATLGNAAGSEITGNLSMETYFKWHAGMGVSTLVFGLETGPKMLLTYNSANHAADQLGLLTLGDYRSAPGFTNWTEAPEDDAGIEIWGHAGVCITSTGTTFDPERGQHTYNQGSVARFYISSHLVGNFPDEDLDIAGMATATSSRVLIQCSAGSHLSVDEFTIWKKDWSDNGSNFGPFSNGRGSGESGISQWSLY